MENPQPAPDVPVVSFKNVLCSSMEAGSSQDADDEGRSAIKKLTFHGTWQPDFQLTYQFCFHTVGLRISAGLRLSYMKSLFAQPIAKLDIVSSGAVSNTITSSANTIQVSISDLYNIIYCYISSY